MLAMTDTELGNTTTVAIDVVTRDHAPIQLKPCRTPLGSRETVEKAIDKC